MHCHAESVLLEELPHGIDPQEICRNLQNMAFHELKTNRADHGFLVFPVEIVLDLQARKQQKPKAAKGGIDGNRVDLFKQTDILSWQ